MIQGKRWMPLAGLVVLTVILILFFKEQSENPGLFLKEQGSNLLNFATQNLKPLFAGSPISKEDVFNFAFYEELPLDKDNDQYIQLGSNAGQEYFEFRKSPDLNTNNLQEFKSKLNLSNDQREQIDSILDTYSDQLRDKILVNENNTIAINTNLWNLRKAVLADIMTFAAKSNRDLAGVYYDYNEINSPSVNELIRNVKTARDSNYIFITPDTIFTRKFMIDKEKLREDMAEARKTMQKHEEELLKVRINFDKEMAKHEKQRIKNGYKFQMDSDYVRIEVPEVVIPDIVIPDVEHLMAGVEEFTKNMQKIKVKVTPPTVQRRSKNNKNVVPPKVPDTPEQDFELNLVIPDIDSLVLRSLSKGHLLDVEYWEEFGRKMDSLGEKYEQAGKEFNSEEFKREMQSLQKELQKEKNKKGTSVEVK